MEISLQVVRESLRKTLIEDSSKGYSCTKDRDTLGRLSQVTLRLSGGHVAFTMKLSYNERGQVSARSTAISGGSRGKVNSQYIPQTCLGLGQEVPNHKPRKVNPILVNPTQCPIRLPDGSHCTLFHFDIDYSH